MTRGRSRAFSFILLSFLSFALAAPALGATTITNAGIEARGDYVELRFALRGGAPVWRLEPTHQRLVIELEHTRVKLSAAPAIGAEAAPITGWSAIRSAGGVARIAIDVSGKIDYAVALTPTALIVRFARAGAAPDIARPVVFRMPRMRARRSRSSVLPVESITPSKEISTRPRIDEIALHPPPPSQAMRETAPLVVIDPGHGGRDPGTESVSGLKEKDLALDISLRLAQALNGLNVRTELTRSDDRFLRLGERTATANRARADLFVSIHLNSSPDRRATGIETYFLNNTTDRATIRLARMENEAGGDYSDVDRSDLHYILTDLRQGYKANEAASLSRMVEAETAASVRASMGLQLDPLGARTGPFYVLVGAEMPSILVECGFLSNPGEARLLDETRYQQALADGIAAAIVNYLNGDKAVGNL